MRISDWSSDVCSSDLCSHPPPSLPVVVPVHASPVHARLRFAAAPGPGAESSIRRPEPASNRCSASGRSEERRVGKEWSVRVDLGGRRIIKKKKNTHTHQNTTKTTNNKSTTTKE